MQTPAVEANSSHTQCLICGDTRLVELTDYRAAFLCKCNRCGFVFSKNIPTQKELDNYYAQYGVSNYLSPITVTRYHQLLDQFEKYRSTGKILDVGCGVGFFLQEAKKRGWEVYGTDYGEGAVKSCGEKGIRVSQGKLDPNNYQQNMFDVVTSFEVIEHINYPLKEVENIKNILRPGGVAYITTPNYNSLLRYYLKSKYNVICYPEHLCYFTPKTLNQLFKTVGFRTLFINTNGLSVSRFRTSLAKKPGGPTRISSDDEKLRNLIENKKHMQYLKNVINLILTASGKGDSIKALFMNS